MSTLRPEPDPHLPATGEPACDASVAGELAARDRDAERAQRDVQALQGTPADDRAPREASALGDRRAPLVASAQVQTDGAGDAAALDPSDDDSSAAAAAPTTTETRPRAARERVRTLLRLLDDPSPTVWSSVRRELERLERPARAPLQRACDHPSPLVRARARALLLAAGRKRVLRRLIAFASRRELDLESGLFLLARLAEPDLDVRPFLMQFDALAAEVLRRVESRPPTLERALALVTYLGQELGLSGDSDDYHHPDNIYVHRVLQRRRGMPLSLAAIYQSVGRRAGIQSALVPLPGHVMLRVRGGGKSALVDVFQKGERRTERELLEYLAQHNLPFQPSWFRDADDASMFQRQVLNLKNSYARRGLAREARGLGGVLAVLERRAVTLAAGART